MILEIDDEMVDKITVQNLIESLQLNREMSKELMEKETLETYEATDLADQLKAIKNFEMVLSYYLTPAEYERRIGKPFPA